MVREVRRALLLLCLMLSSHYKQFSGFSLTHGLLDCLVPSNLGGWILTRIIRAFRFTWFGVWWGLEVGPQPP